MSFFVEYCTDMFLKLSLKWQKLHKCYLYSLSENLRPHCALFRPREIVTNFTPSGQTDCTSVLIISQYMCMTYML